MKYIISIYFIICFSINIKGQICTTTDIFNYDASSIVKNGTNATIVFNINYGNIPSTGYSYRVFTWNFGDGTPIYNKVVYLDETYTSESHVFDLNNTSIVDYGVLQATVSLKIEYYASFTTGGSCQLNGCYSKNDLINYVIPSGDMYVSLTTDPTYNIYPVGLPVKLFYYINPSSYSITDNLTYSFELNGSSIATGSIQRSDLNQKIQFYTYTPSVASTNSFEFTIRRFGNIIGTATKTITAESSPGGGTNGDCACGALRPSLDVTYKIERGVTTFTITDISSQAFINKYGGCAPYDLYVFGPPNEAKNFENSTSSGHNYPFVRIPPYTYSVLEPDVYESPKTYIFRLTVECKNQIGPPLSITTEKQITIQPHVFSKEENTFIVPFEGLPEDDPGLPRICTHSPFCKSAVISYRNSKPGDFSWLENFRSNPDIDFTVGENDGIAERVAEVKLFVNGNYDKCVDVVNGVKKGYRTITIKQESKVKDLSGENIDKFGVPVYTGPAASYYSVSAVGPFGQNNLQGYFFQPDYFPLNAGVGLWQNSSYSTYFVFKAFDSAGNEVYSKNLSFYRSECALFDLTSVNNRVANYDITSYSASNNFNLDGAMGLVNNKALSLTAPGEVNLTEGFEASEGNILDITISPCHLPCIPNQNSFLKAGAINDNSQSLLTESQVDNEFSNEILVYPNPNRGSFTIINNGKETLDKIEIIDNKGATIDVLGPFKDKSEVCLNNVSSGIYFLKISTQEHTFYKKVIINNF